MLLQMCVRAVLGLTRIHFGESEGLSGAERNRRLEILRSYRKQLVYVRDGMAEDWAEATEKAPGLRRSGPVKLYPIEDCLLGYFLPQRIGQIDEEIKRLSEPAVSQRGIRRAEKRSDEGVRK
jgi:hypothetical protein